MGEIALDIDELRTTFFTPTGPVEAVAGVSLSVEAGRMVGLVGESGAGKTTLATSIMCSVRPPGRVVGGETRLFGRDLQGLSEDELRKVRGSQIAMIVPNPRAELNPLIPVGVQIANVASAHLGLNKKDAMHRAIETLKEVKIPDPMRRAAAYPHELSGGMAQRIVIAMALVARPKVTISDDATSGLDVTVQAQILDLTSELLRDHHAACLMITRDLGIVANYCDTVAVLYRGRLLELADLRSFFARPQHPYSIELLDAFSYDRRARMDANNERPYDHVDLAMRQIGPSHFVREVA